MIVDEDVATDGNWDKNNDVYLKINNKSPYSTDLSCFRSGNN